MSWIGRIYDHLHDDLHLPELPGMDRDRAEDIVAEAFAPGSPIYHQMRRDSQVAEFLLPGLDLNFEANYNDFYGDLVGEERASATEGSAPSQDGASPPPRRDAAPPPDKNLNRDLQQDYVYPLPNEWSEDSPVYTVVEPDQGDSKEPRSDVPAPPPGKEPDRETAPEYIYPWPNEWSEDSPVFTIDDPPSTCPGRDHDEPGEEPLPPATEEPCDPPAEGQYPDPTPIYIAPLPGEDGPPEWNMPIYPPATSQSGFSDDVFRHMAGGDRELSAAELKGSIDEAQNECSPHDRAIRDFSGIVDINDDCSVSKFETEATIGMIDADRNGTVSLAELNKFLEQLHGAS